MAIQVKTITIGKSQYRLTQLGAREGRILWLKVAKIFSSALKAGVIASDANANEVAMVTALDGLINGIESEVLDELCEAFGKVTEVQVKGDQGEKWPTLTGVIFDQHFAANYLEMTKWIGESIMWNFASFLGEASLGSAIARVQVMVSKFQSQKGSTGKSGESSFIAAPQ